MAEKVKNEETKVEVTKAAFDSEELVDYTAPVDPTGNKQDVIVAVNGETVRIKRGVAVKIKRKFWQVLQDAAQQEMAAWQTMRKAAESKQA